MFYLKNVASFEDDSGMYAYGAAKQGGAIYCDSCTMVLKFSKFLNFKALNGGTIVLDNRSNLDASDLTIIGSYAISQGGALSVY